MWKIFIYIFFLNSLVIAEPWPDNVLEEFQRLGETVLHLESQSTTFTLKISPELKSHLFARKGSDRLQIKRGFNQAFTCTATHDGVKMRSGVLTKFKQFFQDCRENNSFRQPEKIESSAFEYIDEAPTISENPNEDQSAHSAPIPVLLPQHGSAIVCIGPKTIVYGEETSLYLCYPFLPPSPLTQTAFPYIDVKWDADICAEFQELGHKVLDARAAKQSFKVSEELKRELFKQRGIGEFELKSFRQATESVRVRFVGEDITVKSKELEGFKRFFRSCLTTRFEQPTLSHL